MGWLRAALTSVLILLSFLGGRAQSTVFVSTITHDYIVIAIDGRRTNILKKGETSDIVCKVVLLPGNIVYFGDGLVSAVYSDMEFYVLDLASNIVTELGSGNIKEISDEFEKQTTPIYQHLFSAHEKDATRGASRMAVLDALFAGFDGRDVPTIAGERITYSTQNTPKLETKALLFQMDGANTGDLVNSHPEIFKEFKGPLSERAKKLLDDLGYKADGSIESYAIRAKAIATAIRDWSGDTHIGGDIAVLKLERGKDWAWLDRPNSCPDK